MILALDLDDTIHDRQHVSPGYRMGIPEPGAVSAIKRLVEEGHTIIIFTARNVQDKNAHKAVADWLDHFQIPFSGITNIKSPHFDLMIDNRAIHYDSWPQVMAKIHGLQQSKATYYDFIDEAYKVID